MIVQLYGSKWTIAEGHETITIRGTVRQAPKVDPRKLLANIYNYTWPRHITDLASQTPKGRKMQPNYQKIRAQAMGRLQRSNLLLNRFTQACSADLRKQNNSQQATGQRLKSSPIPFKLTWPADLLKQKKN